MHHVGRLIAALRDREPVAVLGAVGAALTWAGGEFNWLAGELAGAKDELQAALLCGLALLARRQVWSARSAAELRERDNSFDEHTTDHLPQ